MPSDSTDFHNRILWLEVNNAKQDAILEELRAKADYLFLRLNVLEGIDDAQSSEGTLRQLKMVFAGEEEEDNAPTVPEFNQECLQIRNDTLQKANDGLYANLVAYRVANQGLRKEVLKLTAELHTQQHEYEALTDYNQRLFIKNNLLCGALVRCQSFLKSTTGHTWATTMSAVEDALKNNGEEKPAKETGQ